MNSFEFSLPFSVLNREEAYAASIRLTDTLAEHETINPLIPEIKEDLLIQARALQAALSVIKKNQLTNLVDSLDGDRDDDCTGINAAIQAAIRHYKPTISEAGKIINAILLKWKYPFQNFSFAEETTAIRGFLSDLSKPEYAEYIGLIPELPGWIARLTSTQEDFESAIKKRDTLSAQQKHPRSKIIIRCIRQSVNTLQELAIFKMRKNETAFRELAKQIAERLDKIFTTAKARKARKKNDKNKTDTPA